MTGEEGRQHPAVGRCVHQPRRAPFADVPQFRDADRHVVQRQRQRLGVEVAPRNHLRRAGLVEEDERVVGDRVQFDLHRPAGVGDRIVHGPVHLGYAAQRVGILDVARVVGADEGTALQQAAQIGGAVHLARVRSYGVQSLVEGHRGAVQRLQAQCPGGVPGAHQVLGLVDGESTQRGCHRRPVDQRQPLLGLQLQRLEPCLPQRLGPIQPLSLVDGLPLADEHQRQVGQGSQVATGTQRADAGDDGKHPAIEQRQQRLDHLQPHAGVAPDQRVGSNGQRRPRRLLVQRLAYPGGVAAHQVALQFGYLLQGDDAVLKSPEAGGDAVGHLAASQQSFDPLAGPADAWQDFGGQPDGAAAGDGDHVLDGQTLAVEHNRVIHRSPPHRRVYPRPGIRQACSCRPT